MRDIFFIAEPQWRLTNRTTVVTVDESPVGLGAVLQQFKPDNEIERQKVSCISRMLTEVERRYSQCEKETLGVVWAYDRLWI